MERYSAANVHIFILLNKKGKWHPETHLELCGWPRPVNALIIFGVQMQNEQLTTLLWKKGFCSLKH